MIPPLRYLRVHLRWFRVYVTSRIARARDERRWRRDCQNTLDPNFRPSGEWVTPAPRSEEERRRWLRAWMRRRRPAMRPTQREAEILHLRRAAR